MSFQETLASGTLVLTEGAVIERLRRDPSVILDPHVLHAGFVYHNQGRKALEAVYRGYLDVGQHYNLPMIVLTPTWRANPVALARAGFGSVDDVNRDCTCFMFGLRDGYAGYAREVYIGGLMGPAGDAYRPEEALRTEQARAFHAPQVRVLAEAGVDFVIASTLSSFSESQGMAQAMAESDLLYILSFVVRSSGELLDGTPLHRTVSDIDSKVQPRPAFYMLNCVHPTVFARAFTHERGLSARIAERVIGLQANTSARSPEELDGLAHLEGQDPQTFADEVVHLYNRFGTRVLGGCCGTDERHIACIAQRMTAPRS